MLPFSRLTAASVVFSALFGFDMIYSLSRSSAAQLGESFSAADDIPAFLQPI